MARRRDDSGDEERVTASAGPALTALPPLRPQAQIRLRWADATGAHEALVAGKATLGAGEHPRVHQGAVEFVGIDDETVSRAHAEIYWHPLGAWVRDLDSHNGTFIESIRVRDAQLHHGAKLQLGRTTVHIESAEATQVALWPEAAFGGMVGRSEPMRELFMRLAKVADSDAPVLIQGETGTGKDLVARTIHSVSKRAGREFVVVDCASLASSLVQSELFGHAKGAFTGAERERPGVFELAHGGTVFLDEVGDLPLEQQTALLRVLSEKVVKRVGENRYRPVDVRILAATHRDLPKMVNAVTFREDLYFRLRGLTVTVPPLRDRPEDIPLLAAHFLGAPPDAALETQLLAKPWPGNVRELQNAIEQARVFGQLEPDARRSSARSVRTSDDRLLPSLEELCAMPLTAAREALVSAFEYGYIAALTAKFGRAAVGEMSRHADVDRSMVYRLMRKYL